MITEIITFLSALLISTAIIVASRYIAWAIRPSIKPDKVSRDLLGRVKQAQIIKKKDNISELFGE